MRIYSPVLLNIYNLSIGERGLFLPLAIPHQNVYFANIIKKKIVIL